MVENRIAAPLNDIVMIVVFLDIFKIQLNTYVYSFKIYSTKDF